MNVYEIYFKVYLLKDIELKEVKNEILRIIDITLGKTEETLSLHNKNIYKNYCFNSFYPLERDGLYKADTIYTITIRTIDRNLANYFNRRLPLAYTPSIRGLKTNMRTIPVKKITRLYSITPVVIKNDCGYWRNVLSVESFERRLRENLIKKYNEFFNEKIDESFDFYTTMEMLNTMPIGSRYKERTLLGDKISIEVCDNEEAQKLAYIALGTGIGEMNARGFGYVGYKFKK